MQENKLEKRETTKTTSVKAKANSARDTREQQERTRFWAAENIHKLDD